MPFDTIKALLENKTAFQVVWVFIFVFILAIVRIVYFEISGSKKILRSGILSIGAGMIAGLLCYHFELPFLMILFITSLASFTSEKFWDGIVEISKEFPKVFKELLYNYIKKGK